MVEVNKYGEEVVCVKLTHLEVSLMANMVGELVTAAVVERSANNIDNETALGAIAVSRELKDKLYEAAKQFTTFEFDNGKAN